MYRQILIHKSDLPKQKILWRFSENEPIQEYVLLTVTYGLKASPFLAIRTMVQLAADYKNQFPRAAHATQFERYMDDYMSGSDTEEELMELYNELNHLTNEAGMELGKWKSNNARVINQINVDLAENEKLLELNDEAASILGLKWQPSSDCFVFEIKERWGENTPVTKRNITSAVAKIYDPNGYLSPIVITAKAFIQETWKTKAG